MVSTKREPSEKGVRQGVRGEAPEAEKISTIERLKILIRFRTVFYQNDVNLKM
jgi:hypothetical protein